VHTSPIFIFNDLRAIKTDAPFPVFVTEDKQLLRLTGGGLTCVFNEEPAIVLHKKMLGKGAKFREAVLWHEAGHLLLKHEQTANVFKECVREANADLVATSKVGLWAVVVLVLTVTVWAFKNSVKSFDDTLMEITKDNLALGIAVAFPSGVELLSRSVRIAAVLSLRLLSLFLLFSMKKIKS
jgi:hypothetical protein